MNAVNGGQPLPRPSGSRRGHLVLQARLAGAGDAPPPEANQRGQQEWQHLNSLPGEDAQVEYRREGDNEPDRVQHHKEHVGMKPNADDVASNGWEPGDQQNHQQNVLCGADQSRCIARLVGQGSEQNTQRRFWKIQRAVDRVAGHYRSSLRRASLRLLEEDIQPLTGRFNVQVLGGREADETQDRDRDPQRYQSCEPAGVPDLLTAEEQSEDKARDNERGDMGANSRGEQ